MKKAIALVLAAGFVLSLGLFVPIATGADAKYCFDNWEVCRARALNADEGWVRIAIMLTVCDLALGKCLLLAK